MLSLDIVGLRLCYKQEWGTELAEIFLFRLFHLSKAAFNPGSQQSCGNSFATTVEKVVAAGRGPGLCGRL